MPALTSTLLTLGKLALEETLFQLLNPVPLADGEAFVSDDLTTTLPAKEKEPLESEPRTVIKQNNQIVNIYYDFNRDNFDPVRSTIPRQPVPLDVTDTKNVYTEDLVQGLQQRRYGSLLYKVKVKEDFKYRTFFGTTEKVKNFYNSFFDKVNNVFTERINKAGLIIDSLSRKSLTFVNLPNVPDLNFISGIDMLLKYQEFLLERQREILNFPILPIIVDRFFSPEEPDNVPTPAEKLNTEPQDQTKRFISAKQKIDGIYQWLGIEDLKPKVDLDDHPIELKTGEYNQDYYPAESILKHTILKQFTSEELDSKTPPDFDSIRERYKIRTLPDLITALISVLQYRMGADEYPLALPQSFTDDETYPEDFQKEEARIKQELQTLPFYSIPTKKELEVQYQQYLQRKEKDLFSFDVQSLAEHLSRSMLMVDELIGQYPLKISIEENDLIKTDGEVINLDFPNLSEAIKEMLRLNIEQKAIAETNLNASVRALIESGNSKTISYQNYYLLQALQEHFGYSTRQIKKKLPMLYDILALKKNTDDDTTNDEPLSALLNESELVVSVEDYNDKQNWPEEWQRVVRAAAITHGVHMVNLGKNLANSFFSDQVKKWKQELDKDSFDFEQFIKDFEDGYSNTAQTEDPTKPFGQNKDQRPRIKTKPKKSGENINNGS